MGIQLPKLRNWRSAFLPGIYQGTYVNPAKKAEEAIIPNLNPARSSTRQSKQLQLSAKIKPGSSK
jgi:hypothetical protein